MRGLASARDTAQISMYDKRPRLSPSLFPSFLSFCPSTDLPQGVAGAQSSLGGGALHVTRDKGEALVSALAASCPLVSFSR